MLAPDRDFDLLVRKYKERDEHGRLPHHWLGVKAQTHTQTPALVGVQSILWNLQALITRDNKGETPLDIARRSGACAEIIGLLSLTPEEAHSLGGKEMLRLYAPVAYWRDEMVGWIQARSWADCHKFNEHNDELVREVLKYNNSNLLREIACNNSQVYSEVLVFLALRMINRHPPSLADTNNGYRALQFAEGSNHNAFKEIRNVLRLTPTHVSSTPFPALLRQHLPKQFVDSSIFGTYNTACTFIKHMKYDKAGRVGRGGGRPNVDSQVRRLQLPGRETLCTVQAHVLLLHFLPEVCVEEAQHKKTCKAPTRPPTTEAKLRTLHKGIAS